MNRATQIYSETLESVLQDIPVECMPALIKIIDAFKEGVTELPNAKISLQEGLRDIKEGRVYPIDTLWDGID